MICGDTQIYAMMCFKAKIMSETCTLLRIYFYPRKTIAIFMILCYNHLLPRVNAGAEKETLQTHHFNWTKAPH